ncbi:MAG: CBS domain-containing protein [Actinomycetota bacterium]|nr:CBS domain-containing protein [Actinomycetota bacterium]
MTQSIREVMAKDPVTVTADATVLDAARCMRDRDIGDVMIVDGDRVTGILTDRDIVVRAIAEGRDPATSRVAEVASMDLVTLSPEDSFDQAVKLMRQHDIRRLPIVENGRPVGIVSIGDLAMERDRDSVLGDISSAPPNN